MKQDLVTLDPGRYSTVQNTGRTYKFKIFSTEIFKDFNLP